MSADWQHQIAGHWLPEVWAGAIDSVLQSFGGGESAEPLQASADTPNREEWETWKDPYWFAQPCDAVDGAALLVGAPRETLAAVWKLVSGEEPDPDGDLTTALETYRELLNQAATTLSARLMEELGHEVRIAPTEDSKPFGAETPAIEIRLDGSGGTRLVFALGVNAELAKLLFDLQPAASSDPAPSEAPPPPETALVSSAAGEDSMHLLRKVELELAVSFGQTTMTLEQAIKLSSGSIVELNRSVSEPVELLVNESVIARGEVVVVDGNYGVRITEIARPSEMIKDLR